MWYNSLIDKALGHVERKSRPSISGRCEATAIMKFMVASPVVLWFNKVLSPINSGGVFPTHWSLTRGHFENPEQKTMLGRKIPAIMKDKIPNNN